MRISTLTNVKCKKQSRMENVENQLRVGLSEMIPAIPEITKNCQSHISR